MDNIFSLNNEVLKRTLHKYSLQAELLCNKGLYKGKLGVAILFYYYGRYSSKPLYGQFADELVDDIVNDLSVNDIVGFGYGLSGIGWGIQHLIEQKFVEGDVNEVLSELDLCIMQRDPRRMLDLSFDSGISGINHYIGMRLQYAKANHLCIPFDEVYLSDLEAVKGCCGLEYYTDSCVLDKIWSKLK